MIYIDKTIVDVFTQKESRDNIMKIFTTDIEDIENEVNYLSKTLSKIDDKNCLYYYRCLDLMIAYASIFTQVTRKNPEVVKKRPELILQDIELTKEVIKKSITNVMKNKPFHFDILLAANYSIACSDKIEKSIFDDNLDSNLSYSEEEMNEIITDYLKKYHSSNKNLIKKLIDENAIYLLDIFNGEYAGYTITNDFNKKHKIIIDAKIPDMEKMISLVHEIGHVVDNNEAIDKNIITKYIMQSNYKEVISSMYEKEFLEFLIEENIESSIAKMHLANYYGQVYSLIEKLYVASTLNDELIENEKYTHMSRKEILEKVFHNPRIEKCDFESGEDLDIYVNTNYGYGKLLGTYFSHLRGKDKEKYNLSFNKFLDIRAEYFDSNIFKNIDTTKDEIFMILNKEKDKVFRKK